MKRIITITGAPATGTTTLARRLQDVVGWHAAFSEEYLIESPYFARFLEDPNQWAFHNQVFFVGKYLQAYSLSRAHARSGVTTCLDYAIQELWIYCDAMRDCDYLTADEHNALIMVLKAFESNPDNMPDATICLSASTDTLLQRIRARSRPHEDKLEVAYLIALQRSFHRFQESSVASPILSVSSDEVDFSDDRQVAYIAAQIARKCE